MQAMIVVFGVRIVVHEGRAILVKVNSLLVAMKLVQKMLACIITLVLYHEVSVVIKIIKIEMASAGLFLHIKCHQT